MNALATIDPIRRAREAHAKFFPPARPVNLVADALASEAKRRAKLTPFQRALEDIAAKHGIPQADILGPSKAWPAVRARHELMHHAVHVLRMPLERIGRLVNRHHTTVLAGERSHRRTMARAGK